MEYKRIEELTSVVTGGTPSTSKAEYWEDGDIPWLQSGCCQNCDVYEAEKYITQKGYDNSSTRLMPVDTVMIALTVATAGKIGYLKFEACGNQSIIGILPCDKLDQRYLFYYLLSQRSKILSDCIGGAQPHISQGYVKNMNIPVPTMEEQRIIVGRLKKLNDIIMQRQNEIELFDKLIKARFVEMFASKNYPREDLDSLSYGKGEYGAQSASMEYDPSRPRYVRITDINDDGSLNEDYVCSSNADDDETYKLTYGDFCFARMGATVGKSYAYKSGNQIFAGYLIRYKLRLDKVIPEYLYEFTRLDEYWNWVLLNQSGAAQPGINAKKYGSLLIPRAPLEEQQKFAEFVKQVDKSKVAIQKSLEKTQLLFDSLMQKYFG